MMEIFEKNSLKLEVAEEDKEIVIIWSGESTDRHPGNFIKPVLLDAFSRANRSKKAILLDFRKLKFMNSSTITPIIRLLHGIERDIPKVKLVYSSAIRWQEINFSALRMSQQRDARVEITGE